MVRSLLVLSYLLLWGASPGTCPAQFLFLDSNGDGKCSTEDVVSGGGITADVWLVTDTNADGSRPDVESLAEMTINSYELILKAIGGRVRFEEYQNLQPTMILPLRSGKSDTEMYVGYAGPDILPPGKYLLGSLKVSVLDGDPSIVFASESSLNPRAHTSFGSRFAGIDGNNTLRLWAPIDANNDTKSANVGLEGRGDWTDTGGLRPATMKESARNSASFHAAKQPGFSAVVERSSTGTGVSLRITTAKPGKLKVVVFDVRGRAVRTVVDSRQWPAGTTSVNVDPQGATLASGIYFYRVTAGEGELNGQLSIVK